MHGILIALRDAKRREAFASTLARAGWPVAACADVEAAAQILGAEQTALLIGDARSLRGEEDDPDLLTAAGHRGLPCLLLGGIDAPDEDAAPAASCHVLPGDPDAQALLDAVRGLLPEPPAPPAAADGAEDDAEANAGDEAGDEAMPGLADEAPARLLCCGLGAESAATLARDLGPLSEGLETCADEAALRAALASGPAALLLLGPALAAQAQELLAHVRDAALLQSLPVVVLWPDTPPPWEALFAAGASDVLPAAVAGAELAARLRGHLQRRLQAAEQAAASAASQYGLGQPRAATGPAPTPTHAAETARADAVSAEARTLAEANRELERKNRELDEARGQALAAASNRSAFIANISHEIRTPLNAVLGMIELLGETELNREQREWLHLVEHSGQQLLHLVRDVLDFSKIEAGEITVNNEPFDITDCVEDAVTLTAFQSQQQGVEVAYDIGDGVPAQLLGDGWRVRQILLNYLQNAIKHGRGGQIEVRITRHPAPDGQAFIRFCVRDDGPGIPEQQLRQLFQRFSQLAGGERTDGAGLGLAISRHLAELMGGRVWGSSEMGEGSAFYLELPAREAASPPSPEEEAQRRFLAGRRVLVAERQPLTRQRLQGLLRGWGATVVCAESGEDVLTLFGRGEGFALALIDQQLPDMDCEELAGELRGSGRAGDCVLLLGTGMGDASSCPQDYRERYSKPLRRAALRATLQAALGLGEGQPRRDGDRFARMMRWLWPGFDKRGLEARDGPAQRVLLVEDNKPNQQVVSLMLQSLGVEVRLAEHGQQALQQLDERPADVVLMDINMPVMDGITAAKEIHDRRWPGGRPYIIALSADPAQDDSRLRDSGLMDDYLMKPVGREALQQALQRARGEDRDAAPPQPAAAPGGTGLPQEAPEVLHKLGAELGTAALASMLQTYADDLPEQLRTARNAAARGDVRELRRVFHSTKSSSRFYGEDALSDLCQRLEGRCQRLGRGRLGELLGEFETACAESEARMRALLPQLAATSPGPSVTLR